MPSTASRFPTISSTLSSASTSPLKISLSSLLPKKTASKSATSISHPPPTLSKLSYAIRSRSSQSHCTSWSWSTRITRIHGLIAHHPNERGDVEDNNDNDLFFVSLYSLSKTWWLLVIRLHTGAFDRSSVVALLAEMLELIAGNGGGEREKEVEREIGLGIEEYIPSGKANKPF
ncbi:hypothetical protein LINPERPRIM_LOCUS11290 [Linum perenne]